MRPLTALALFPLTFCPSSLTGADYQMQEHANYDYEDAEEEELMRQYQHHMQEQGDSTERSSEVRCTSASCLSADRLKFEKHELTQKVC